VHIYNGQLGHSSQAETISEMLVINFKLTELIDQEDFIALSCYENFKYYTIKKMVEDIHFGQGFGPC
jgi:coenzyme F420-reducing hydrogenase beta subunit